MRFGTVFLFVVVGCSGRGAVGGPGGTKFPPSGVASSGGYGSPPPPVCAYAADGHTCPQPSDHERTEMVKWIDTGFPE